MISRIAEYFSLGRDDCKRMLILGKRLNRDLWNILSPTRPEEIEHFYKVTPYYVFDLAYWHMSSIQRRIQKSIVSLAHGDILDFGGGIGSLSVSLAQKGNNVTYVDVSGFTMRFAKWLFSQERVNIKVVDAESFLGPKETYDTVICFNVVEHLLNPEKVLEQLTNSVKKGGILIIRGLESLKSEELPMHTSSRCDGEQLLRERGMLPASKGYGALNSRWIWYKK